jgi:hypothetical protein
MKKVVILIISFALIVVLCNCSSGKYVVSTNGDKAEVKLNNGKEFVSELVSIQDTAIIFATIPVNPLDFPNLFFEPIEEIQSITIQGYDGSGWGGSVLLFQVLPAALIAGAAVSYSEGSGALAVGLVCAIPAAITALLFSGSAGETPQWNNKMSVSEIENLKKYSRYPEGMSQEELSKLLIRYNLTALEKYF